MDSIEKLREWSHRYDNGWIQDDGSILLTTDTHGVYYGENYGESIRSMIDEIEAEAAERERLLKQSESATEDYYKDMIAEEFMPLPTDADGVPIRVGDVLEYNYGDGLRGTHTVRALIYDGTRRKEFDGGIWDFEFDDDDDGDDSRNVNCMSDFYECNRHHRAPTVEDVLGEFAELPERIDRIAAIPRIADKLREVLADE